MAVELDSKVFKLETKLDEVEHSLQSHILSYNLKLKA